jgi:hypothetical protein
MESSDRPDPAVKRPRPTMLDHLIGRLIADRRPTAPTAPADLIEELRRTA